MASIPSFPPSRSTMPPDLKLVALSDQSVFVRAAISGVIREGIIAAALTGLLILLFLGSWRSTLIITISIPLSILASVACLSALGETINIMTLGGLALSVGILVDDATVTIENINYHLEQGAEVEQAILDGAHQIALPALVSTLSICIVFVPMFQLAGIAKYLFIPLAEAVVFAMLASYILSRTLIPTLAKFWLKKKDEEPDRQKGPLARFQERFEHGFARMRDGYRELLDLAIDGGAQIRGNIPAGDGGDGAAGVSDRSVARARSGLLSVRGCRPAQAPLAGEHRNAHRGHRRSLRRGRKAASARPYARTRSPPSWTISVFRTAASISRTAPPRRLGLATRTFSSTWPGSTIPWMIINASCAPSWRPPSPRHNFNSCRPTSSARF